MEQDIVNSIRSAPVLGRREFFVTPVLAAVLKTELRTYCEYLD